MPCWNGPIASDRQTLPVHHEAQVHHEAHEATKRHKDWHHGGHRGHREGLGLVQEGQGRIFDHEVGAPSGDDALSRRKPGPRHAQKPFTGRREDQKNATVGLRPDPPVGACLHANTSGDYRHAVFVAMAAPATPGPDGALSAAKRTDHLRRNRPTMPWEASVSWELTKPRRDTRIGTTEDTEVTEKGWDWCRKVKDGSLTTKLTKARRRARSRTVYRKPGRSEGLRIVRGRVRFPAASGWHDARGPAGPP